MENFKLTRATAASFAGTIFFTIMVFVIYVLGYKHNQLLFYIQTLSLMGFVIDRDPLVNVVFLNNLRYSYFNYDKNPLQNLIPRNYLERCPGNYFMTSIDCNIVRNIGMTLILALIVEAILIIGRIAQVVTRKYYKMDVRVLRSKKIIFRALEFFHKATQYPLVFFSIQTLLNAEGGLVLDTHFKNDCIALSSMILAFYLIIIAL